MPPARSRPQSPFNRQALCEPLVGYSGQPRFWFWTTIYHFLVSDSGSVNYVRALPESTRIAAQKEIATLLGFDAEIDADWLRDQVSGRPLISVFGRFGETPERRLCWIFFESIASGQGLKRRGSSGTWVYRIFRVYPDKTYDTLRMIRPTPAQPTLAEISNFVHLKEGTPYRTDWIFTWTDTGAAPVRDLSFETAIRIAAIGDTFELRTRTPHGKDILDAAMKVRNFPAPGFAKLRSYGEDFHVYVKVREVERSSRTNGGRGENRGYRTSWRTAADELRRMIFPFGPSERVRFTPDGSTFRELPWPIRNIPGIKPDSYAQANERSSWNHTSNWVNALASRDGTRLTAVVKLPHSSATDPALSIVEYLRNPKSGLLSDGHQIHSSRDPDDPQASEFFGPDLYYTTDNRITFMSQHVVRRGQTFHAQYRLYQRLGRDEIHYGSEIVHESGRIEGRAVHGRW